MPDAEETPAEMQPWSLWHVWGSQGKEAFFFNHDSGQSAPYSTFDTWLVSGFRVYFEGLGFKV